MTLTAPVYGYVCPKCVASMGDPCVRVQKRGPRNATAPSELLDAHKERYAVWHAWEKNRQFSLNLPLYSVRKQAYKIS